MKKLLLVLLVVALASFLFVGCLPTTPSEGEDEGQGEPEVPTITIKVQDEYDNGLGDIYIRCDELLYTVTFAEALAADQDVWLRFTDSNGESGWILTSGSGTEFTVTAHPEVCPPDCEPICIEVMVGDICCSEVLYHETRIVDSEDPYVTLYVEAEDCGECDDMVNISFYSSKLGECDVEEDCCGDDCSGVAGWTAKLWADGTDPVCDGYCVELEGNCPVDASTGCLDCLVWPDTGEAIYWVEVEMSDNVGNTIGGPDDGLFRMVLDTDEIIHIDDAMQIGPGEWMLWDMCDQNQIQQTIFAVAG